MSEPLNFQTNLGAVDTSRPTPDSGAYVMECTAAEGVATKEGKPMWKLTLVTTGPCQSYPDSRGESKPISPGFQVFDNALMYQVEYDSSKHKSEPPDYRIKVASIYDAFNGTDNSNRPESYGDLSSCVGKKCIVKGKVEVDKTGEYGAQFRVKSYAFLNS